MLGSRRLAKKTLNTSLALVKGKHGSIALLPKALYQQNPFLTQRLMTTDTRKKPGTNTATSSKQKANQTKVQQTVNNLDYLTTEAVAKELGIGEVFDDIIKKNLISVKKGAEDEKQHLKIIHESLTDAFRVYFGETPDGILKGFKWYTTLKDPSNLGVLMFNLVKLKGSFAGNYGKMNKEIRKIGKSNIPTKKDEQADHAITIADVNLKLVIHSLKNGLPKQNEIEEIGRALNHPSNLRAFPKDLHAVFTTLGGHSLDYDRKRMLTVQDKLKKLTPEKRILLKTKYLDKMNKQLGIIQEEYCHKFTSKLSSSRSNYVKSFASNFQDFYINFVFYTVQKGGGFGPDEQTLLLFLLNIYDEEDEFQSVRFPESVFTKATKSDAEIEREAIKNVEKALADIKNAVESFFAIAKELVERDSKETEKDMIEKYDNYMEYISDEKNNERLFEEYTSTRPRNLRGGKTRKLRKR